MKIGIITYHSVPNFGANLQTLSTVGYLRNHGHTPYVINWMPHDLESHSKLKNSSEQLKIHEEFCEKHLPCTKICRTDKEVAEIINKEDIEAIIIGSDAVWHHVPCKNRRIFSLKKFRLVETSPTSDRIFPNPFWGTFSKYLIKKIPIAAISASTQNMPYLNVTQEEKLAIGTALKEFKQITVRDDWSKNMVKFFTKDSIAPTITPDPVFGFNQNIASIIPDKKSICARFNLPEKYLLLSFFNYLMLPNTWMEKFIKISTEKGYTCIGLPTPTGFGINQYNIQTINLPLCPLDWYALIKYSSGYVGNNMHPIIVSLSNSVPCFCFDQYGIMVMRSFVKKESSKIYHILKQFNLEKNRFPTKQRFKRIIQPEIVVRKIEQFDVENCKKRALEKLYEYNKMMEETIKVLSIK